MLQTPEEIIIVGEENHVVRHIYLTDQHDPAAKLSYFGDSIGHWEGNALVVETTLLKQGGKIIEHFTKAADGSITDVLEQSGKPAAPAGDSNTLYWSPGDDPYEWICEDFSDNYMKDDFN